ncbi:MBL fold metallo-hydrolase [Blastopirellula marina]|uniref:MBL fold metallo-hydrolase n=1 Tax=Blastopirellula marina TaxID=124 RepID=A0A2S8G9J9_9BACT|nr:MBL fold metallo-hydrolase [Blastopirellula marina]PQO41107.1 MBL fold metallo-hydrolase [Blastopirellula marina]PTL45983.1 MBL fold metallo-hydrolase [Blastopirellula marina]
MLLKYFYDKTLAHASYMVGCQRAKVAVVIDPGRDIQPYLDVAKQEGLTLTDVAETHIHADYVSGARELAERVGAKLHVSDEGPAEWKYEYASAYPHQMLHEGDHFMVGNIRFEVMHTPGHTPESISFVLTDQGGGANKPMGVFTGDFVFVNAVGRPDLLEQAAGIMNTAEAGAKDLFISLEKFKELPDYLQVWPAHGAGSACGKGLGAIPSSTVGYEKLFNPGLQYSDEAEFVQYVLADQPEVPPYFAVMKRVNKEGPRVLGDGAMVPKASASTLTAATEKGTVIDLAPASVFAEGHLPGSINIPSNMLGAWAGWLVDYDRPTFLIGEPGQIDQAAMMLSKIGVEDIREYVLRDDAKSAGLLTETYETVTASQLAEALGEGTVDLIDVRTEAEWNAGHIAEATHHFLGRLPKAIEFIPHDRTIVVQCRSGARSAIGVSVLQAAGLKNVINLQGGYLAWTSAGLPSVQSDAVKAS